MTWSFGFSRILMAFTGSPYIRHRHHGALAAFRLFGTFSDELDRLMTPAVRMLSCLLKDADVLHQLSLSVLKIIRIRKIWTDVLVQPEPEEQQINIKFFNLFKMIIFIFIYNFYFWRMSVVQILCEVTVKWTK